MEEALDPNYFRNKIGFVKFVSSATTTRTTNNDDNNDVSLSSSLSSSLLSSSSLISSSSSSSSFSYSCWPALIFTNLEEYKNLRKNLQSILSHSNQKKAIIEAETAITNHKKKVLQAGGGVSNNHTMQQQQVAFLLGSELHQQKQPRLIFEDDDNILELVPAFMERHNTSRNDKIVTPRGEDANMNNHDLFEFQDDDDMITLDTTTRCPSTISTHKKKMITKTHDSSSNSNSRTAATATAISGAFREAAFILSLSLNNNCNNAASCSSSGGSSSSSRSSIGRNNDDTFTVDQKNEPEFSVKRLCFYNIVMKMGDDNDNTVIIPWPAILIRDMTTFPDNVINHKVQVLKQTSENDQRRKMAITNRITINNAELVTTIDDDDSSPTIITNNNGIRSIKENRTKRQVKKIKEVELGLLWKDAVMVLSEKDDDTNSCSGSGVGIFLFGNSPFVSSSKKIIPYCDKKVRSGTALSFTDIAKYCNVVAGYQEAVSESMLFSTDYSIVSALSSTIGDGIGSSTTNPITRASATSPLLGNGNWCWLEEGRDDSLEPSNTFDFPEENDSGDDAEHPSEAVVKRKRKKNNSSTSASGTTKKKKVFQDVSNTTVTAKTRSGSNGATKKRKGTGARNKSLTENDLYSDIGIMVKKPSLLERYRSRDVQLIPDFSHVCLALVEAGHKIDTANNTYEVPGRELIFHSLEEYRSYLCLNGVALVKIKDRSAKKEERFQALMAWVCYHRVERLMGSKDVSVVKNRIDTNGFERMLQNLGMMYRSNKWEIPGSDERYDGRELEDKLALEGIPPALVENSTNVSREELISLELYLSCPFLRSNRNNTPFFKAA